MTNNQNLLRKWHPIEEAIIEHVDRYGMTTPEAAFAAGVRGMNDVQVAESRLQALSRRGDLVNQLTRGHFYVSTKEMEVHKKEKEGSDPGSPPEETLGTGATL